MVFTQFFAPDDNGCIHLVILDLSHAHMKQKVRFTVRQYQLNNLVDKIFWAKNVHTVRYMKWRVLFAVVDVKSTLIILVSYKFPQKNVPVCAFMSCICAKCLHPQKMADDRITK